MSYQFLVFSVGERPTAAQWSQILENIRTHVHGEDGVTEHAVLLVIQPDSDQADDTVILEIQKADGTSVLRLRQNGKIEAEQSQIDSLSVSDSALVSNLNAEFWRGRLHSDLLLRSAGFSEPDLQWEGTAFYYNGTGGSTTSTSEVLQFSTTFTLDNPRKQQVKFSYDRWTDTDGEIAWAKVVLKNSAGDELWSDTRGTYATAPGTFWTCYSYSIMTEPTTPATFNETITIEFYLWSSVSTATASWSEFYAFFPKGFVTGRVV
jgi:hypothetical protein